MIRFIGDVHQQYDIYMPILPKTGFSVQVGDMGFDYSYLNRVKLNGERHKILRGNHDNPAPHVREQPFFLGNFGVHEFPGEAPFFYVSGAWSIDHAHRKQGIDWWPEEELSLPQLSSAIELYRRRLPEIVVSHEAPHELVKYLTEPSFARRFGYHEPVKTRTSIALQMMFNIHQPKTWIFGHYHRPWDAQIGTTRFVCLDVVGREGCVLDL